MGYHGVTHMFCVIAAISRDADGRVGVRARRTGAVHHSERVEGGVRADAQPRFGWKSNS